MHSVFDEFKVSVFTIASDLYSLSLDLERPELNHCPYRHTLNECRQHTFLVQN